MSTSPDALDDLLKSLPSAGAPPPPTPKPTKKPSDPLAAIRERNPDFAKTASDFMEFAKRGGVPDAYIKSGYRTAEQQNALFTNPKTHNLTKGNDGYIKLSPHQEARAIDWSTKNPANRAALHRLIEVFANRNNLYVPTDEPWHMSGRPNKLAKNDTDDLDALMRTVPTAQPGAASPSQPVEIPQQPTEQTTPAVSPTGLQKEAPAAPKPPAILSEKPAVPEYPGPQTEEVPVYQPPYDEKAYTGNVGRIMNSGPQAEGAYRQFLQRNVAHVKGKAASTDELIKNESLATVFTNLQDYFSNNPKAKPHEQARAIAQMGVDWLKDPNTKGQLMPTLLHTAMLEAHWTPDEFQALPGALRAQIGQRRMQEAAERKPRGPLELPAPGGRGAGMARAAVGEQARREGRALTENQKYLEDQIATERAMQRIEGGKNFNFGGGEHVGGFVFPKRSEVSKMIHDPENRRAAIVSGEAKRTVMPGDQPLQTRVSQELKKAGLPDFEVPKTLDEKIQLASKSSVFETPEQRQERVYQLGQLRSAKQIAQDSPAARLLDISTGQTGPGALGEISAFAANVLHFADTLGGVVKGNPILADGLDEMKAFGSYMRGRGDVPTTGALESGVKSGAGMLAQAEKYSIMSPGPVPFWAVMGGEAALANQNKPLATQAWETGKGVALGLAIEFGVPAVSKTLGKMPGRLGAFARNQPAITKMLTSGTGFGAIASAEAARQGKTVPEIIGTGLGTFIGASALSAKEAFGEAAKSGARAEKTPEWLRDKLAKAGGLDRAVVMDTGGRAISLYGDPETQGVGGEEVSPDRAENYATRGADKMPVMRVTPEEYDQVKNLIEGKPTAKPETTTKTITGETEAPDAGAIRSDQGQSAKAAPEVQREGTESARSGDLYREGQGRGQVEPGEVAPSRQEAVQSEASVAPSPGIARVPISQLNVDPERFQYKMNPDAKGATGSLSDVNAWNPDLAGTVMVWHDPADNRDYVVNGHNRYDLAKRTGQKDLDIRYINAPNAEQARARGALVNIAEGQGTVLDAAKFFRDSGHTPEDLTKQGVSLKKNIARDGLALSKLNPFVFNQVVQGELKEDYGVLIGNKINSPDLQDQALKAIKNAEAKGHRLDKGTVEELIDSIGAAPRVQETEQTLFGDITSERSLVTERAQVAASLKRQLAADKSLFGTAARQSRRLAEGGTVVDVEQAKALKESAEEASGIFDTLKNRSGLISDILDEGARQVASGQRPDQVAKENYERIKQAVQTVLGRGSGSERGGSKAVAGRSEGEISQRSLVEPAKGEVKPIAGDEQLAAQAAQSTPSTEAAGAITSPVSGESKDRRAAERKSDVQYAQNLAEMIGAKVQDHSDGKVTIQFDAKTKGQYPDLRSALEELRRRAQPSDELDKMLAELPKEDVAHGRQTEEIQSKTLSSAKSAEGAETSGGKKPENSERPDVRPGGAESEGTGRSTQRTFGPGAAAKGDVPQEDPLTQFASSVAASLKEKAPKNPDDSFNLAEAAAEKWAKGKDAHTRFLARLNAFFEHVTHWYDNAPGEFTQEQRARGLWDANLQKLDQQTRLEAEKMKKKIKPKVDAAMEEYAAAIAYASANDTTPEEVLADWASKVTGSERRLYARAAKLSDEQKTMAHNALSMMEQEGEFALDPRKVMPLIKGETGPRSKKDAPKAILHSVLEDYFPRQVKQTRNPATALWIQGKLNEFSMGKLPTNFKHSSHRVFGTKFEGRRIGVVYQPSSLINRIAEYHNSLFKAIGNRLLLKDLTRSRMPDGRPAAIPSGEGSQIAEGEKVFGMGVPDLVMVKGGKRPKITIPEEWKTAADHETPEDLSGYKPISHPNAKGWRWIADVGGVPVLYEGPLLFHPDIHQEWQNRLSTSWFRQRPFWRGLLRAQGEVKSLIVAGGLFHPVQMGLRGASAGVLPLKDYNPFSLKPVDFDHPTTWLLARTGTQFEGGMHSDAFTQGLASSGLISKVPLVGPLADGVKHFTFQKLIPALVQELGHKWYARNKKLYPKMNEEQLGYKTSEQLNAFSGLPNYRYMGRSPSVQDFFRMMTFAPAWTEGKVKTPLQAIRPYGRNQLYRLLVMAGGMYLVGRVLNRVLDDDAHWNLPFTVVYGDREYGLRSDVGDLQFMFSNPRLWASHRLNFLAEGGVELLTKTDARGQRVDFTQAIGDILSSMNPIAVGHPFREGEHWWNGPINSIGITNYKHFTDAERVLIDYMNEKPRVRYTPSERQTLIHELKAKSKKGDVEPELVDALEKGKLTLADTRQIRDDAKMSDYALMLKHAPLEIALNSYEVANTKQKNDAKIEMALKLQNAKPEMFTDEMRARLEKDGFTVPAKIGPKRKTSEPRREAQKTRKEQKAVKRWLPPEARPTPSPRRYQVTPR